MRNGKWEARVEVDVSAGAGVSGPFLPQGINKENNMAAKYEWKSMTCASRKSPADGNDRSR